MQFIDTHAHIHFKNYGLDAEQVWRDAQASGVSAMLAVGCDVESSESAVKFANEHEGAWAVVGIHPHEATKILATDPKLESIRSLLDSAEQNKVVAIGEFGLDYYYEHSPKLDQQKLVRTHLEMAQEYDLPVVLHIRDAFDDFWPIFDALNAEKKMRGVVHSFTAHQSELEQALDRGFYVAINGIITFTKDEKQLDAAKSLPLNRMLLETDAPFLTPKPFRGTICKPEHIVLTAEFLATLRGETVDQIASTTTQNAINLFDLPKS